MDQLLQIEVLITAYRPGFSLDAGFYTSDTVSRRDLERIFFSNWVYAGHLSQLHETGSGR